MRVRWMAALAVVLLANQAGAEGALELKDKKDRVSYSIGMDIGTNMKKQMIEIDPAVMARGIADAFTGGKTLLTEEEAQGVIQELRKDMMAKQQDHVKQMADNNRKEGEAFLAANKDKEGVKALPSGLQYKVLKAGDGATPKATDTVETNYRGTLINGTEFDSSYKRGQTATFPVKGVIAGWTEALQLMKVGDKWQLFIPSNLAYGERGAGRDIGPHATLIFEIELVSIK